MIDVGQGDSTLIVTPNDKKILIDGGGSSTYDVGENILVPYLLDRKIKKIDYMMISHFDEDHVGGLFTVLEKLKVENVIISKQAESSENFEKFFKIVKEKKIHVIVTETGKIIHIDKDLYFNILWPDSNNFISENSINNNSIVCKLVYKNFSMLFTGDIEEIAEKQILEKLNHKFLEADILKVAHHGSKSSSIEQFVKAVNPKIALIGVGENNTFGHPNDEVIERLDSLRCEDL